MACHSRGESGGAVPYDVSHSAKLHMSDSVAEWRSREQLEPSPPSTSPAYWDSDEEDDLNPSSIIGPKPSDLYGKFTWKIENFSEISKRELRSNVFEVGGYKWYILVYPQGCDVCNHLSLFLCVADYDKLLPGWSHFAQFTIAVVNKDPKKSKYSDTLHRFCKKEHDWGWKKFMELSKVLDGFTVADTLVIKAQVQVIRENPHRPFRCLDCQYRRELVRVYLTNVEGICRRFVEEKREKLGKLIEDTPRWTSFRAFWSAVEEGARRRLAREKTDVILKAVVKRFFNEKEVTSTLVMDALYSGCKALDYRSRNKKGKINGVEMEETVNPVVWVEKDAFVLAGDVLTLLERAVSESLPPYKDDKGPQNRTKDVGSGDDFGKDSVERDERRLTELGRRTVEMFVLAHLYTNRVEVAYREAVALKRQEELIREEEAAGQAETEMRAKREAAEKEKRSKKKQAKQRRKDRKERDKEAEEKKVRLEQEQRQRRDLTNRISKDRLQERVLSPIIPTEAGDDEDNLTGLDPIDDIVGTLGPATEDGDTDHASWEREGSYVPNGMEAGFSGAMLEEATRNRRGNRKQQITLDDSSSTCSSDSLPSVRPSINDSFASRPILPEQSVIPRRGGNRMDSDSYDNDGQYAEAEGMLRATGLDANGPGEPSSSSSSVGVDSETVILSLKDRVRWLEQRLFEKEEEVVMLQEQLSLFQHQMGLDRPAAIVVEASDLLLGVRSVDESRGETSTSFLQSDAGDGSDVDKGVTLLGLGRANGHWGSSNGVAAFSSSFQSTIGKSESINSSYASASVKPEPTKNSSAPCRSRSVDSSRPPRILTPPITGFSLSVARASGVIEESSVPHSLPATGATAGASISRPSSAPGLGSGARPSIPLASSSSHPAQPLARSMSAGPGRLGAGGDPVASPMINGVGIQASTVTPSYKNATIGKTRSVPVVGSPTHTGTSVPSSGGTVSTFGSGVSTSSSLVNIPSQLVSHAAASTSSSAPSSSPPLTPSPKMRAVPGQHATLVPNGYKRESGSFTPRVPPLLPASASETAPVNQLLRENSVGGGSASGHTTMGITFGTVTPELLPDDQLDLTAASEHSQHEEREHYHRFQQEHQQQQGSQAGLPGHSTVQQRLHQHHLQASCAEVNGRASMASLRQTTEDSAAESIHNSSVLSEEFPHLDIINDLLDEDPNLGMALKILQHPVSSTFSRPLSLSGHSSLHKLNYGQLCSDRPNGVGIDGGDRSRGGDSTDERPSSNGLRDNVRMGGGPGPYQHSSLARLHSQHGGVLDGVSSHFWPIGSSAMPTGNNSSNVRNGLVDQHIAYSLVQGHHQLNVPDCSGFSLGHNGYTVYAPQQQP